jgi:hypothetical protein
MDRQPLRFLVEGARIHGVDGPQLDPQLRKGNSLMLYAGLTCVLDLSYSRATREFVLSAAATHDLSRHDVKRRYSCSDVKQLAEDLRRYLASLRVDQRHLRREGNCQTQLSMRFGIEQTSSEGWATVDTQSVIGFSSTPEKDRFWAPIQEKSRKVLAVLAKDPKRFGRNVNWHCCGGELDLLLWDPLAREFIVMELKDGGSASGVYLSPLQVGCYLEAWRRFAAEEPRGALSGLRDLMVQRKKLGLIHEACQLPETEAHLRFRPAIVVQSPQKQSSCWAKLEIVRRTVEETWPMDATDTPAHELLTRLSVHAFDAGKLTDISEQYARWTGCTGKR